MLASSSQFVEKVYPPLGFFAFLRPNSFSQKSIDEQLKIMTAAKEAYDRIQNAEYKQDDNGKEFQNDLKIVKSHFGYDPTVFDFNKMFSEFKCDIPNIEMSADNILHEICEDKGKKHKGSDTDLFIFVLDGEMDSFKHLIETHLYNSASDSFFKSIINSPFRRIFLCEWDYFQKKYILENPELFLLEVKNGGVEWKKL